MTLHDKRFPNESREYRQARNDLLQREIALRQEIEDIAKLRRQLPLGGKVEKPYLFQDVSDGRNIELASLFANKDTLIVYNFMYRDANEQPCPSCNSLTQGFNASAKHVEQHAAFVVVAKANPTKLKSWVEKEGWRNIRILSSEKNSFNKDYLAESEDGFQLPLLHVFHKKNEEIYHFYSSELLFPNSPWEPRHVDSVWPLWNLLDLTPGGRGGDWHPQLEYV